MKEQLELFLDELEVDALLVRPEINYNVRKLCVCVYRGHPKGCPNYNNCDRCPPKAPYFDHYFDTSFPVWAIVQEFDLGAHSRRMLELHPKWSYRQSVCVLYWQAGVRKILREKCERHIESLTTQKTAWAKYNYEYEMTPEAMGVQVFKTLAKYGVILERHQPLGIVRLVALVAKVRDIG